MDLPDYIQSEILASFLLEKAGSAKIKEDFEEMFLWINLILESRRLEALDKHLKFCMAIVIVGN